MNGRAIEYLLSWPKTGPDWKPDLSIHKGNDFKHELNVIPFRLHRLLDTVEYECINEERLLDSLSSESAVKDLTRNLLEQTADKIDMRLETKVPSLICKDENFIKYDESTKKGNLYEVEAAKFEDPIWILEQLFNGSSLLRKQSENYNKGYPEDPDDKGSTYKPLETNISSYQKMFVLLDSSVKNKIAVGGYKENVNFQALDLEKRFGIGNIEEDILPNSYKMLLFDERSLQLYKKGALKGFTHKEEPENGNNWFFLKPVIHGGFITAFSALAWKIKP